MKRYANKLKGFFNKDEIVAHLGGDNYTALVKKERTKDFLNFLSGVDVYGIRNGKEEPIKIAAVCGVYAVDDSLKDAGQLLSRARIWP